VWLLAYIFPQKKKGGKKLLQRRCFDGLRRKIYCLAWQKYFFYFSSMGKNHSERNGNFCLENALHQRYKVKSTWLGTELLIWVFSKKISKAE